jgi:hypothetical protein
MRTTVIHAPIVDGKYHFTIASEQYTDPDDSMVFEISGTGHDKAPRSAPSPASRDEMDAWIGRLRAAGYKVALKTNLSGRETQAV